MMTQRTRKTACNASFCRNAKLALVLAASLTILGCGAEAPIDPPARASEADAEETLPLTRGASGELVREANEYLLRYGYYPSAELEARYPGFQPLVNGAPEDFDELDEHTEQALRVFQARLSLPGDGELNAETLAAMDEPRCGFPDHVASAPELTEKWAHIGQWVWNHDDITYRFESVTGLGGMSGYQTRLAIRQAFSQWSGVTNLTLTSVWTGGGFLVRFDDIDSPGATDWTEQGLVVTFDTHDDDGSPFPWTTTSLKHAAIHESGHVIGLHHSGKGPTIFSPDHPVMWPLLGDRTTLHEEDAIAANVLHNGWETMPGRARDIGANKAASGNGDAIWIIGYSPLYADGYRAYEWNGSSFVERPGARGIRIDVDDNGNAWMIGRNNRVYRYQSGSWSEIPGGGLGKDIGVGRGDNVYIIGMDNNVWRISPSGSGWNSTGGPGSAVAVDVDVWGNPWVAQSNMQIMMRPNSTGVWTAENALGIDVGMGGNFQFWNVNAYRWVVGGDFQTYIENLQTAKTTCNGQPCDVPGADRWVPVGGQVHRIAVGRRGRPYVLDLAGYIWRRSEVP